MPIHDAMVSLFASPASKKYRDQGQVSRPLPPHHPGVVLDAVTRGRRASDTQSASKRFNWLKNLNPSLRLTIQFSIVVAVSDLAAAVIFAPNPAAPLPQQTGPSNRSSPGPRDSRWLNLFAEEIDAQNVPNVHPSPYSATSGQVAGEPSYPMRPPTPTPPTEFYDFRHLDRTPSFHSATESFVPDSGPVLCESPRSIRGRGDSYGSYVNDSRHQSTLDAILSEIEQLNQAVLPTGMPALWTSSSGTPTDDQPFHEQQPYRPGGQVPYPHSYRSS
ncbi:hypothetical protein FRC08_001185 [Ceratobasidium sp. 394]|nr:hypothetical protein FRC08_001185 [Ceratobasidium sp. 394]KAG9091127.1 hypothetical protein FS749_016781 [Ceratobasidium sp. UAMH 11750]